MLTRAEARENDRVRKLVEKDFPPTPIALVVSVVGSYSHRHRVRKLKDGTTVETHTMKRKRKA